MASTRLSRKTRVAEWFSSNRYKSVTYHNPNDHKDWIEISGYSFKDTLKLLDEWKRLRGLN